MATYPIDKNPYSIVIDFEERIAKWAGSKYAVSVDSCTNALFLSLMYKGVRGQTVQIPKHTYPGVACSIIHAGGKIEWTDEDWEGVYELAPFSIYDSALRFQKGMYQGGLHCLSFHIKKHLPIGRGGMILTDSLEASKWLSKARFDGRSPVPLLEDYMTSLGWNMYMEPTQAARGIQLFELMRNQENPDLPVELQGYPDLSQFEVYNK